jgi:hypothetical protein
MKNNFLTTALKALKKQRNVYQTDRDRYEVAENTAKQNKENCESEINKLDEQISVLEKQVKQRVFIASSKELELT